MRADVIERLAAATERTNELLERQAARENERIRQENMAREERRLGRRSEPTQLTFGLAARAVPGLAGQFRRKIPSEFWTLAGDRTAEVACPCGATPRTAISRPVECPGVAEGEPCGRFYLYDGANVRVFGGPKEHS